MKFWDIKNKVIEVIIIILGRRTWGNSFELKSHYLSHSADVWTLDNGFWDCSYFLGKKVLWCSDLAGTHGPTWSNEIPGKHNCLSGLRNSAMAKARGPGAAQSPVCQLAKIAQMEVLTNPCLRRGPTPPALAGLSVTFDSGAFFCWLPIAIPRGLFAFTCFPFDTAAISLQYVNTQKDFHVCSSPGVDGLSRLQGRIDMKEQPLRRRPALSLRVLCSSLVFSSHKSSSAPVSTPLALSRKMHSWCQKHDTAILHGRTLEHSRAFALQSIYSSFLPFLQQFFLTLKSLFQSQANY